MVNVLIALINRITHCKSCAPFELDPQVLRVDPWRKTNVTLLNILAFCLRIVLKDCIEVSKGLNLFYFSCNAVIDENPAQTIQSESQKRKTT